jgi:hypothetical protein
MWRNLFNRTRTETETTDAGPRPQRATPPGTEGVAPPQRQTPPETQDQRRIAGLRRQRRAILYDIEQGELAAAADNPWTNRIALLGEALETVAADLATASQVDPGSWHPLPADPVAIDRLDTGDAATVVIEIAGERFVFAEEQDWAERGHQVARSELSLRAGDVARLIPTDTPESLREPLAVHLADSLFVFATDLRDRALDDDTLPQSPTLADLARPCPVCGGWTDWRGTCQACARRNAAVAALKREESRLLDERQREADERHRLVEGLPLARRRLKDVETELARLGDTSFL